MERVVLRFVRSSKRGSFDWWRHVAENVAATEEQRLLSTKLLARGLGRWARKSASMAFLWWRQAAVRASKQLQALDSNIR